MVNDVDVVQILVGLMITSLMYSPWNIREMKIIVRVSEAKGAIS